MYAKWEFFFFFIFCEVDCRLTDKGEGTYGYIDILNA
jgi:hypothetical protein